MFSCEDTNQYCTAAHHLQQHMHGLAMQESMTTVYAPCRSTQVHGNCSASPLARVRCALLMHSCVSTDSLDVQQASATTAHPASPCGLPRLPALAYGLPRLPALACGLPRLPVHSAVPALSSHSVDQSCSITVRDCRVWQRQPAAGKERESVGNGRGSRQQARHRLCQQGQVW